jgi:membrane-associated phospholipid phosphatase
MFTKLHQIEITWIEKIQELLKGPFLDLFFLGWNFIDSFAFITLLITVIWHLINRKKGIQFFFLLILSAAVSDGLKHFFGTTRPCHINPSLGLLCLPSYGFPSGAAQTAVIFASIIFFETKKWIYRSLAVLFAFFLCFSRIYLGVHYISDILGGIIVGIVIMIFYQMAFPIMEKNWKKTFFLFPLAIFFIGSLHAFIFVSFTLGVELGLIAQGTKPIHPKKMPEKFLTTFVVIIGLYFLAFGEKYSDPLRLIFGFVMGAWLSYLGEWSIYTIKGLIRR